MMQRKRFFSGDGPLDLPLTCNSSGQSMSTSCTCTSSSLSSKCSSYSQQHGHGHSHRSPPTSNNSNSSSSGGSKSNFDYVASRLAPNRTSSLPTTTTTATCSTTTATLRPNKSLSPSQRRRPYCQSAASACDGLFPSSPAATTMSKHSDTNLHNVLLLHHQQNTTKRPASYSRAHNPMNELHVICTLVMGMGLILLGVLSVSTWQQNSVLQQEIILKDQELDLHIQHSIALEGRVQRMRGETHVLKRQLEELEVTQQRNLNNRMMMMMPSQEELAIQRKVFHLELQRDLLHRGIQLQSQRMVLETYGPGPVYYVEMKLQFHPDSNIVQDSITTTELEDTILLETARLDHLPHTIWVFLEQVRHGFFNGNTIYKNAPHILQAGPHQGLSIDRSESSSYYQSLAHVLFQEFSPHSDLTHAQPYTVGYTGRPTGGPDFFVNLKDNSALYNNGPPDGSSSSHDASGGVTAAPDPCFARVIAGFNVVERMHRSDVVEDMNARRNTYSMVHPVNILSMRIVQPNELPPTLQQQLQQLQRQQPQR